MKDRQYYEIQLCQYPDVLTMVELKKVLGCASDKTIKHLVDQDKIQYFMLRKAYRFPKTYVIDFMMSEDYVKFCRNIEVHRCRFCKDGNEKIRRKILLLCEQPRTRRELMYLVDVESVKTFKRLYLQPLLDAGQLKMTVPGRKSVSTQKYVRVRE